MHGTHFGKHRRVFSGGLFLSPPNEQANDVEGQGGSNENKSTVATELEGLGIGAIESCAAGIEMPVSFELLGQGDIWICDTGASSNVTR